MPATYFSLAAIYFFLFSRYLSHYLFIWWQKWKLFIQAPASVSNLLKLDVSIIDFKKAAVSEYELSPKERNSKNVATGRFGTLSLDI